MSRYVQVTRPAKNGLSERSASRNGISISSPIPSVPSYTYNASRDGPFLGW